MCSGCGAWPTSEWDLSCDASLRTTDTAVVRPQPGLVAGGKWAAPESFLAGLSTASKCLPCPTPGPRLSVLVRPILEEILRLPPDERLKLVEDIWASLVASPTDVPVPDWHRDLLDDRLVDEGEQATRSWDEVQANARRSRE